MGIFRQITEPAEKLVKLYIDDAKLGLIEKLTKILSGIAIIFFGLLALIIGLTFFAAGATILLANYIPAFESCFIIGGIYLAILILILLFRKNLIINPICRFLSRTIINSTAMESSIKSNDHE